MFCNNCGNRLNEDNKYCGNCGKRVERNNDNNLINNQNITNINSYNKELNNDKANGGAIAALVLGIISIISSLIIFISLPVGLLGYYLAVKNKDENSLAKTAKKICTIGLSITCVIYTVVLISGSLNRALVGSGYKIKYDYNWSVVTMSNNKEALKYNSEESYLIPIGKSSLSDTYVDFTTENGRLYLYNQFYKYWNNENDNLSIYGGSDGFTLLKDDIYIATYNYGTSKTNIKGKYFLLVSKEKNVILSFMSNSSNNVEENDNRVLELIKEINIEN